MTAVELHKRHVCMICGLEPRVGLESEVEKLKAQLEVITKVFKEAMDRLSQYNAHKYWVEDELKKIEEIGEE